MVKIMEKFVKMVAITQIVELEGSICIKVRRNRVYSMCFDRYRSA